MPGPRLDRKTILNILLFCLIAWLLYSRQQPETDRSANRQVNHEDTTAPRESGRESTSQNSTAGQFDYYALVLSWSPSFCTTHGENPQCTLSTNHRPYNFVLHGLWPQYQKGWPQDCRLERPPFVPEPLISSMLDIMPARQLIIHEYKKHGTCSGLTPEAYFDLARKLYRSIKIPARFQNPSLDQTISPNELLADFLKSNPELQPNMIAISCDQGGGNQLKEIHVCMSRDGNPAPCGRNEVQRKMCDASVMSVPPVRTSASNQ